MVHARVINNDGNGFPGGVRLSWPAVSTLLAALSLGFLLLTSMITGNLRTIQVQVDSINQRLTRIENQMDRQTRLVPSVTIAKEE